MNRTRIVVATPDDEAPAAMMPQPPSQVAAGANLPTGAACLS